MHKSILFDSKDQVRSLRNSKFDKAYQLTKLILAPSGRPETDRPGPNIPSSRNLWMLIPV